MTRLNKPARPTPEQYIDSLIQRLYFEEDYWLVADVDEQGVPLPDEARWEEALAREDNDERLDKLLEQYDNAVDAHEETWRPLGRAKRLTFNDDNGNPMTAPLFAAPPLLPLGQHAKAVLVKNSLQATRIMVLLDQTVPKTLKQQQLLDAGEALSQWQSRGGLPVDPDAGKTKRTTAPVLIELVLVGDRTHTPAKKRELKTLIKRFNPRQKVFVSAYIVDTKEEIVWSSTMPWSRGRRKNLAHALRYSHQTRNDIIEGINRSGKNPALVATGIVSALCAYLGSLVLLIQTGLHETSMGLWLPHFFAPLVAILATLQSARLKHSVDRLAQLILVAYLALYAGVNLYLLWPPSVMLVGIMAVAGFLLWIVVNATAILMKYD